MSKTDNFYRQYSRDAYSKPAAQHMGTNKHLHTQVKSH